MSSLEKKMFHLPNRLFTKDDKMFLSFNLSVIPRDMDVTSMILYLPFPNYNNATKVYVKKLTSKWSEESIKRGNVPTRSKIQETINSTKEKGALIIDVTSFRINWRLKRNNNHGIYIRFKNKKIKHFQDNPPYLIIETK